MLGTERKSGLCLRPSAALALALILFAAAMGTLPGSEAEATLYNYRLVGGPFNRYYTATANVDPGYYDQVMVSGVNAWNYARTAGGQPVFSATRTTNWNISAFDFYANNYGPTGFRGQAFWFGYSGNGVDPNSSNWYYAELHLNSYYMDQDKSIHVNRSVNTAAHELGHAIAVAHPPNIPATYECQLMWFTISNYDACGTYAPRALYDIPEADRAY